MTQKTPNIVMLICDGMRVDWLGALGQTPCQTPTWDKMVREGALLEQHRTTGPMCSPARASILTGLQPHQAGMATISYTYTQQEKDDKAHKWPGLSRPAFAQSLREVGYETFHVGKWHVGENNIWQWYDWAACWRTGDPDYTAWCKLQGVPDGFVFHDPVRGAPYRSKQEPGMSLYQTGMLDIPEDKEHNWWVLSHAIELLHYRPGNKPFFFTLSFEGPHPPLVVPREYYDMYDPADVKQPENWESNDREPGFLSDSYYRKIRSEWSDDFDDWRKAIAVSWGYTTYVDRLFGIFLNNLEQLGVLENTVVVMLSDHGDMFGQHMLSQIFCPYDEVLRVPCVIRAPGQIAPGRCVMDTSHVDIAPTILALAGTGSDGHMEGENLLPYLNGSRTAPDQRDTFCQYNMSPYFRQFHGVLEWRSLLRRPWKYVLHQNGSAELFNIEEDPGERNNRASLAQTQPLESELRRTLLAWCKRTSDRFVEGFPSAVSPTDTLAPADTSPQSS